MAAAVSDAFDFFSSRPPAADAPGQTPGTPASLSGASSQSRGTTSASGPGGAAGAPATPTPHVPFPHAAPSLQHLPASAPRTFPTWLADVLAALEQDPSAVASHFTTLPYVLPDTFASAPEGQADKVVPTQMLESIVAALGRIAVRLFRAETEINADVATGGQLVHSHDGLQSLLEAPIMMDGPPSMPGSTAAGSLAGAGISAGPGGQSMTVYEDPEQERRLDDDQQQYYYHRLLQQHQQQQQQNGDQFEFPQLDSPRFMSGSSFDDDRFSAAGNGGAQTGSAGLASARGSFSSSVRPPSLVTSLSGGGTGPDASSGNGSGRTSDASPTTASAAAEMRTASPTPPLPLPSASSSSSYGNAGHSHSYTSPATTVVQQQQGPFGSSSASAAAAAAAAAHHHAQARRHSSSTSGIKRHHHHHATAAARHGFSSSPDGFSLTGTAYGAQIKDLTRVCKNVAAGDLSQRVTCAVDGRELTELKNAVNKMIDSVERSTVRP